MVARCDVHGARFVVCGECGEEVCPDCHDRDACNSEHPEPGMDYDEWRDWSREED